MVVRKAFDNLKEGSKDDKVAFAGGFATVVVVVLLAAWVIFFLRGIQRDSQQLIPSGIAQDQRTISEPVY